MLYATLQLGHLPFASASGGYKKRSVSICWAHPQHIWMYWIDKQICLSKLTFHFNVLHKEHNNYICCVFRPVNGCSACGSLVKINFLTQKQLFPSLSKKNKEKKSKPYKNMQWNTKRMQKVDFNQRTVCGAPICWSKYTTYI